MAQAFPCPACARSFAGSNARFQHVKAKHGAKLAKTVRPPREMSLGDELTEAIMAAHAGEPVEEYLYAMFRDQFSRGTKTKPQPDEATP